MYRALATDYDGTIAHNDVVDAPTIAALASLSTAGVRLVLVTGRQLDDLRRVFPRLDVFDRIVAENGAVLHRPRTGDTVDLAPPPPPSLIKALRAAGVDVAVGRVILATWTPHDVACRRVISELGAGVDVVLNKGAVMLLPKGVDKASGLRAALRDLDDGSGVGIDARDVVGVGDAENDAAFLDACGVAVAVQNALPALKARVHVVTNGKRGAGVAELVARMLAGDALASSTRS